MARTDGAIAYGRSSRFESGIVPVLAEIPAPIVAAVASVAAANGAAVGGGGSKPAARVDDPVGSHGGSAPSAAASVVASIAGAALGGSPMSLVSALMVAASNPSLGSGCSHVKSGSPNVSIEGKAAARASEDRNDHGASSKLAQGSATVFVNGKPLTRVGDRSRCTGVVTGGASKTFIGGPPSESGGSAGAGAVAAGARALSQAVASVLGPQLASGAQELLTRALPGASAGLAALGVSERAAGGLVSGVLSGAVGGGLAGAARGGLAAVGASVTGLVEGTLTSAVGRVAASALSGGAQQALSAVASGGGLSGVLTSVAASTLSTLGSRAASGVLTGALAAAPSLVLSTSAGSLIGAPKQGATS